MGQFRDLLKERCLEFINESPMEMDRLSFTKLRNEIQKKLNYYEFDINDKDSFEKIGENIYLFGAFKGVDNKNDTFSLLSGHDFIMYIENDIILGAAMLQHITINNGHNRVSAKEAIITTNFTKTSVKGLLYKLYSTYSKKFNTYIVSGDIQTPESKKVWMRWLREKENIKEIFGYHFKEKKYLDYKQISNLWCPYERCRERRIVVKFK